MSTPAYVFQPQNFGALGYPHDDTVAMQNCLDAAGAAHGTVELADVMYNFTAPLTLPNGITIRCSNPNSSGAFGFRNWSTSMFSVIQLDNITFENVQLTCGVGHIFDMTAGSAASMSNVTLRNCALSMDSPNHSILAAGCGNQAVVIGLRVTGGTLINMAPGATVPAFNVVAIGNGFNGNTFQGLNIAGNNTAAPAFHLESTGGGYFTGNTFKNITAEVMPYGFGRFYGCDFTTIDNVLGYDTNYSDDFIAFGLSASGRRCSNITIRNSGIVGGTIASGKYLVNADYRSYNIVLENVGVVTGNIPPMTYPAAQTTVTGSGPYLTQPVTVTPALQAAGINLDQQWASGRWVGSTVSAAPTAGTYNKGDWVTTQTAKIFICTAGGTPGTWQQA